MQFMLKLVLFIMYASLLVRCHRVVNKGRHLSAPVAVPAVRPHPSQFPLFVRVCRGSCRSHSLHPAVCIHRTNLPFAFIAPTCCSHSSNLLSHPKSRLSAQNALAKFARVWPGTSMPSSSEIPIYRWHVNHSTEKLGRTWINCETHCPIRSGIRGEFCYESCYG